MPDFAELKRSDDQDQINRFTTYLAYLASVNGFLKEIASDDYCGFREVARSSAFNSIKGRKDADLAKIGRYLRNAWFTEAQILMSGNSDEFVSYSNHWLPVQCYYSVYLALRAFFTAVGDNVSREHSANLRAIAEQICRRKDLFPYPWRLLCDGHPDKQDALTFLHLPDGIELGTVSLLSRRAGDSLFESYSTFLKTTRRRQVETFCDGWRAQNKKDRMCSKTKRAFIDGLPPTSLFDCLFRLRVRSNYEDVDSFLHVVADTNNAKLFHKSLRRITWYSLFLLEMLIARHISKKQYEAVVQPFLERDAGALTARLVGKRWQTFKAFW